LFKYVIVKAPGREDPVVKWLELDAQLHHKDIVLHGEFPIGAGSVGFLDNGDWVHLNATSESLGITGDKSVDEPYLTADLGREPLQSPERSA
jgi:hypothetical protein